MSTPARSSILRFAESRGVIHGNDPLAFDGDFVAKAMPAFSTLYGRDRWFDTHVRGWDNIPDGPALLVSNHSGGTNVLDVFGIGTSWYTTLGAHRPLHGLAHEVVFATHASGRFLERCGALRAGQPIARRAMLELGRQVIVMPGGDQDVWRPASDRYKVHFANRVGYARMALQLGVPVIPVTHVGAHHTLHVLSSGRGIARRLGLNALARAEIFPVHLSLPWGIAVGPWPHLPPPTRFDYVFGEPILPRGSAEDSTAVAELDARVQFAIQETLFTLRDERRARPLGLDDVLRRAHDARQSIRDLTALFRREGVDPADLGTMAAK